MPRGDGTGPMGTGARIGRGQRYCGGLGAPGYMNAGFGGRGGRGFGRRRGFRHRFFESGLPGWARAASGAFEPGYRDLPSENDLLLQRAKELQGELDVVQHRLQEISPKKAEEK